MDQIIIWNLLVRHIRFNDQKKRETKKNIVKQETDSEQDTKDKWKRKKKRQEKKRCERKKNLCIRKKERKGKKSNSYQRLKG